MSENKAKPDLIIFNYNFVPENLRTYVFKSDQVEERVINCLEMLNRNSINCDDLGKEKWEAWEYLDAACLKEPDKHESASDMGYERINESTFHQVKGRLSQFLVYCTESNDWEEKGLDTIKDKAPPYFFSVLEPSNMINSVRLFEISYIM